MCIRDRNEGYTEAHLKAVEEMKKNLGLSDDQVVIKTNIKEDEGCYDAAVDLAEQGCNIVIANSFGHESYIDVYKRQINWWYFIGSNRDFRKSIYFFSVIRCNRICRIDYRTFSKTYGTSWQAGSGESVGGVRNEEIKYEKYKQTDKKYVDYLRYGNRSIYYCRDYDIYRNDVESDAGSFSSALYLFYRSNRTESLCRISW